MFNLFDLLQAQGGVGVQGFGQQFGLSQDQTRRAMDALLPAMTLGMQRNATNDPTGMAQLFSLVGQKGAQASANTPQMDAWVRQLFGSPHLGQAVLQQAATVSGVATPALKQMLPIMAGMVVAGIVHVMMQSPSAPAPAPATPPSPFGFPAAPHWTDLMDAFLSASGASVAGGFGREPAKPPAPKNPSRVIAPRSEPATRTKAPAATPFDAFQQMFASGLEAQQENAKAMQQLFDTFWRPTAPSTDQPQPDKARPAGRPSGSAEPRR